MSSYFYKDAENPENFELGDVLHSSHDIFHDRPDETVFFFILNDDEEAMTRVISIDPDDGVRESHQNYDRPYFHRARLCPLAKEA